MSKGKQGEKLVIDYLERENRPFSAQDIANNLNGQLSKGAIVTVLEDLAEKKKINEKIYGKQKVYMALQSVDCTNIKNEFRQLDEKIALSNGDLTRMVAENSRLESQLMNYSNKIPASELKELKSQVQEEFDQLNERLNSLKKSNKTPISKEEKNKLIKEQDKYVKEWRKLKRITNDMMDTIMENCNMKKKDLCEDLGIILDEHENVQIPKI